MSCIVSSPGGETMQLVPVLALIVSAVAAAFSGFSLHISDQSKEIARLSLLIANDTRDRTMASLTRDILNKYADEANTNSRSNECLAFANQLEDEAVERLFANHPQPLTFLNQPAGAALERCLKQAPAQPGAVSREEARYIRDSIFSKLNAYETVFLAIYLKEGNSEVLCRQVSIPFRKQASQFLLKSVGRQPRPVQLQDMEREYEYATAAAQKNVCP